jgi:hypothetical protein
MFFWAYSRETAVSARRLLAENAVEQLAIDVGRLAALEKKQSHFPVYRLYSHREVEFGGTLTLGRSAKIAPP